MTNPGVVLRKLRKKNNLKIKEAAKLIGRSVGWLSGVENEAQACRLKESEYQRILQLYNAQDHQKLIHACLSQSRKHDEDAKPIVYDGSILKYLRIKAGKSITAVASEMDCAPSLLSQIENGKRSVGIEMRKRLLRIYGYSPESFKNFYSREKRALNIPARFHLEILLPHLTEQMTLAVFDYASELFGQSKIKTMKQGE